MQSKPIARSHFGVFGSLSFRLGLTVTLGILITSALVTTGVVWRAVERESRERGVEIRATAKVLSANVSDAVARRERQEIYQSLRTLQYSPRIAYATVAAADGARLVEVGHQAALVNGEDDLVWRARLDRLLRPRNIVETVEIRNGGRVVGTLTLAGEAPGARDVLADELRNAAWWAAFAILLGLLIAYGQQRRIIRPLRRLSETMETVPGSGNLPVRVNVDGTGEVGVLVGSYNTMIDQITERDRVIADHRDHLEQKVDQRTRELRIARDQAEQAAEAKSRFLATMSHEIRTPMNGVLVMADLLARSELKADQKGYARVIAHSGRALLDLLNDVLDMSKLDADHVTLEEIAVSMDELVQDVLMLFWEQARGKGVTLASSVAAEVPESLCCDPTRLRQCLANLLGNALKFTDRGHVAVDVGHDGETLTIAVSDTGPGIPEDRQQAIFEAFEQAESSTTRTHGGTGLGLAIVSRLVDAMGGGVTVESTVGEGSRFTIRIPASGEAPARPVLSPPPRFAISGRCTPPVRERLLEALTACGADVQGEAGCLIAPLEALPKAGMDRAAVVLWPFGTPEPRGPLEDGQAADMLPLPYTREDILALVERAQRSEYRGLAALDEAVAETDDPNSFGHLRVLIADDDEVNRQVLEDALAVFGIEPEAAHDGEQAVAMAGDGVFDLIVIDGMMPGMDGMEAARRIRDTEELESRPSATLALFTATHPGDAGSIVEDTPFDHRLAKPFTLGEMQALLRLASDGAGHDAADDAQTDPADTKAVLDATTLETLRALDARRPGALNRVMERLTASLPEKIDALRSACDSGDAETVRLAAHSLKSVSGSAGAGRLSELTADLEMRAAEAASSGGGTPAASETFGEIETAAQQALDAIRNILGEHRGDAASAQ